MKKDTGASRLNVELIKAGWGELPQMKLNQLEELTEKYGLSVASGDVQYLDQGWYVTHAGLLRLALRSRCRGILTEPVLALCQPDKNFWVFKATVFKSPKCRGFVGYGDAHPGNVSPLIFNNAEMRMAETRAVNRALRKAYGVALCSLEELSPWSLGSQQIPLLRRSLQSRQFFRKGVTYANKNPRPRSRKPKSATGRRPVPSPSSPLPARRARR